MEAVTSLVDSWQPFFTAQLGAAATLGGLVFVGLSLNLKKIVSAPQLTNRALLALALLGIILIVSSLVLMPAIPLWVIGAATFLLGAVVCVAGTPLHFRKRSKKQPIDSRVVMNLFVFECAAIPYAVGGWLLWRGDTSAFYWIAAAIIVSFMKAMLDSWVLLVEINR
jgi:hypothetical protein